jgi:hypothetical protein
MDYTLCASQHHKILCKVFDLGLWTLGSLLHQGHWTKRGTDYGQILVLKHCGSAHPTNIEQHLYVQTTPCVQPNTKVAACGHAQSSMAGVWGGFATAHVHTTSPQQEQPTSGSHAYARRLGPAGTRALITGWLRHKLPPCAHAALDKC